MPVDRPAWCCSIGSPMGQTTVMGLVFLFVFTAYYMVQAFATRLYGQSLGANMELTLYLVFAAFCFVAPSVTNKVGCRFTMFLGILGYAALVAVSLYVSLHPGDPAFDNVIICLGGAVCGMGAALLWTAQGRLIMEYSNGTDGGRLFALFWSLFSVSAVIGGLTTAAYFSQTESQGSAGLYTIFLVAIVIGAMLVFLLRPSSEVMTDDATTLRSDVKEELSEVVWYVELQETLQLFTSPRMCKMALIFFYTGLNQPYQLDTFGGRFFSETCQGLELAVFYVFEILGAAYAGHKLDSCASHSRGEMARKFLLEFACLTIVADVVALFYELRHHHTGDELLQMEFLDRRAMAATFVYALWGFSDAMIQSYAYWFMTMTFTSGAALARACGFYKLVQSLGWSIGFALVPVNRLDPVWQLAISAIICILATPLALSELPSPGSHLDKLHDPMKPLTSQTEPYESYGASC